MGVCQEVQRYSKKELNDVRKGRTVLELTATKLIANILLMGGVQCVEMGCQGICK